jgi:hypothetical protein
VKFDPIILGMTKNDVSIVVSDAIRPHLNCECVDNTDRDAFSDHLGEVVAEMLESPPDEDGSWAAYAKQIQARGNNR